MCYRPLQIKNPSLRFDIDHDRKVLSVPCGCCGECRTHKQDEIASRIYYEYMDTIKKGGYVFFQTFTYNEEECPRRHGIRCFDSRHYRLFSSNLRNDMIKAGYQTGYKKGRSYRSYVKIFWTCEYGGLTFRPHYHALFFVQNGIPLEEFGKMTESCWCRCERDGAEVIRHPLGFCDTNNPDSTRRHSYNKRLVDGMGALGYVSKYVCKDLDFEAVLNRQKESYYDGEPLTDEDKKYMLPFTRRSNGLGECMEDMLTIDELMEGKVKLPDKLQGTRVVALPQYIDRHVFYDYDDEDKCFRLNDKGIEMKRLRREHNRGYVKKQINWLWTNICKLYTPETEQKLGLTVADCMAHISDTLFDRFDDFVDYIIYYKDISSTYIRNVDSGVNLRDFAEQFVVKNSTEKSPALTIDQIKDYDEMEYYHFMRHSYGDDCVRFRDFDFVLCIFNQINLGYCNKVQQFYLQRQDEKSRQKYKHSLYR